MSLTEFNSQDDICSKLWAMEMQKDIEEVDICVSNCYMYMYIIVFRQAQQAAGYN